MGMPETPSTRLESYLDAIATNDMSKIPSPVTRIEMYLDAIIRGNKIPAAPTIDGTYSLKVTVSNGETVYSWESDSEAK